MAIAYLGLGAGFTLALGLLYVGARRVTWDREDEYQSCPHGSDYDLCWDCQYPRVVKKLPGE